MIERALEALIGLCVMGAGGLFLWWLGKQVGVHLFGLPDPEGVGDNIAAGFFGLVTVVIVVFICFAALGIGSSIAEWLDKH